MVTSLQYVYMPAKADAEELIGAPKRLCLILYEEVRSLNEAGPVPSPILCEGPICDERNESKFGSFSSVSELDNKFGSNGQGKRRLRRLETVQFSVGFQMGRQ